jgi:hypothetical protein
VSRAARALCVAAALVCCLAVAAVTPAPATVQASQGPGDDGRRGQRAGEVTRADARRARPGRVRPEAEAPVAPERQPLSIETLTPSHLTPGEPVRVTGTVLNDTEDVWGDAQVGMLASSDPLTSTSELSAAAEADPYDEYPGEQVLTTGTFDDIGDVAPGQSRSFSFTVPYNQLELAGTDGVYWVGAELRVTDGEGLRGSVARSLTFLPQVSAQAPALVDLAVLWPLTAAVPWNGQEFVDDSLSQQLAPGGRLRTLAELGASAGDRPLTWILDPAVLDAAQAMSGGFTQEGREVAADSDAATDAAGLLRMLRGPLASNVALAVPYANPDVAALAHEEIRPGLRKTRRAADRVLNGFGVARRALLWPAAGRADYGVVAAGKQFDADLSLLSRDTFADPPAGSVVDVRADNPNRDNRGRSTRPSLVVDREESRLGLRAQPEQSTLQWRQQILANTAVRSLFGGPARQSAIAMPSAQWWPDESWRDADLFGGLQAPWLNRVSATTLVDLPHPRYTGELQYAESATQRELGPAILNKAVKVRRTSRTINDLLTNAGANRAGTDKAFGLSSATAWRDDRSTGQQVATDFLRTNRAMIDRIDLEAPNFVTLSSNSGRFPVSITNRLDEPVTVELDVSARDPRMTVAPVGPVTLQRDQRVTVTVITNSRGVGITTLTARMLTQESRPFGENATFQVRTTQIGAVVWIVMAVGGAVLFIAAGRRIMLRVRGHRRRTRGIS